MVLKRTSMVWILVAAAAVAVLIIGTALYFAPGDDGQMGLQDTGMIWGLVGLMVIFAAFVLLVFRLIPHEQKEDHGQEEGRQPGGTSARASRSKADRREQEHERRTKAGDAPRGR